MVLQLPDMARSDILGINESHYSRELIMQWYEPVCKALNGAVFMQSNVQVFRDRIKPEDMVSLRFASDLLDRFSPERVVAEAELDRIRGLIADLYAELRKDTGIDPELRKFLLYHVRLMEQAINDMPLLGTGSLQSALDQTVGALQRRGDLAAKSDKQSSAWTKFGNLIVIVAAVFQIVGTQLPLPAGIRHELSPGQSVQVVIEQPARQAPPADASR